jgi:HEAT repeat protein
MIKKTSIAALMLTLAVAFGQSHAANPKKLAQKMNSGDVAVRLAAAKELRGAKRNKNLNPIIVQACRDSDPDVRVHAYYAISKADARAEGVVDALIDGTADTNVHVRRALASSLGEMNPFPNTVLPYMVRLLVDPDQTVRQLIQTAFGDMEGLGIGALMRHIETKDDNLRLAIVNALGAMGPDAGSALSRLKKMANDDPDQRVKEAAQRAVRNIERN